MAGGEVLLGIVIGVALSAAVIGLVALRAFRRLPVAADAARLGTGDHQRVRRQQDIVIIIIIIIRSCSSSDHVPHRHHHMVMLIIRACFSCSSCSSSSSSSSSSTDIRSQ
jgi:hypothetical protein